MFAMVVTGDTNIGKKTKHECYSVVFKDITEIIFITHEVCLSNLRDLTTYIEFSKVKIVQKLCHSITIDNN